MTHLQEEHKKLLNSAKMLAYELSKAPIQSLDPLFKTHEFTERAIFRLSRCQIELDKTIQKYNNLLEIFGDDPKEITSEDWFGSIYNFVSLFTKILGELDITPSSLHSNGHGSSICLEDSPIKSCSSSMISGWFITPNL